MNRLIYIVLVCVLVCVSAHAATTHGVGAYVAGGYHTELLPKNSQLNRPNGWEVGLGFDYRLTAGSDARRGTKARFLFNTGVGVSLRSSSFNAKATDITMPHSFDSDGYEFTFIYHLDKRTDQYMRLGAVVPLMVGAEFNRFYFSVGAKVNLFLLGQVNTQLAVSSYGDYPQFLDPFTSMPEHQFFDSRDLKRKQNVSLKSEVDASIELGCLLASAHAKRASKSSGIEVRLAVFADYGLLTFGTGTSTDKPAIQTPAVFSDVEDMFTPIQVNHVLSTTLAGNGKLTPLTAGVRLIVTVPYKSKPSYPCHCIRDNFIYSSKK